MRSHKNQSVWISYSTCSILCECIKSTNFCRPLARPAVLVDKYRASCVRLVIGSHGGRMSNGLYYVWKYYCQYMSSTQSYMTMFILHDIFYLRNHWLLFKGIHTDWSSNHISKPLLEIFASTLGYRLVVATMHCSWSSPLPSPLLPYMSPHPPLLVHFEGWVVGLNRWWSIPFLSVCLSETLFPAPGIPLGTFSTKSLHPCPPPCEALHDRCFCAGSWGHW